ncbi:hypothetical protein ACYPTD_29765 [Klebsiella pneumoniae]|jgi:hypothetical protein|uniref:hypothetical protein n=1 Tax=Klebsiella phage BUCT541 TaxID=2873352 RepID=UPI001E7B0A31|nr:hypothetical protein PRB91_gp50 [Klebsiella phage BUCT541]UAW06875.1 hypothetical protein [Klebsiella phage BUCT541]
MAQCKSTEAQESGHFECNGFAARLKGKHLTIAVTGDKVNAAYDCSLFTHDEVGVIIKCIQHINKSVSKASMVKL